MHLSLSLSKVFAQHIKNMNWALMKCVPCYTTKLIFNSHVLGYATLRPGVKPKIYGGGQKQKEGEWGPGIGI